MSEKAKKTRTKMSAHGIRKYVDFRKGGNKTRILLCAGHGGLLEPKTIPNRSPQRFVKQTVQPTLPHAPIITHPHEVTKHSSQRYSTSTLDHRRDGEELHEADLDCDVRARTIRVVEDAHTRDFTIELAAAISRKQRSVTPHLILNNVKRRKVDVNRPVDIGAMNNSLAEKIWKEYHTRIDEAKDRIDGRGLLIDIHGQSHPEKWIELGYGIGPNTLDSRQKLDHSANKTTISALCRDHNKFSQTNASELISGELSLGALLDESGHKTVPSPSIPTPTPSTSYYCGGYTVRRHGSAGSDRANTIDAIQIELPMNVRRGKKHRHAFAEVLADSILRFMNLYESNHEHSLPLDMHHVTLKC